MRIANMVRLGGPIVGIGLAIVAVMASQPATLEALPATVELQDLQTGFSGTTGTVWSIATDGSFTISEKFNEQMNPPRRSGRLEPEQLARLAQSLEQADAAHLPVQMGEAPPINPRSIMLRVGDKTSTLVLTEGVGEGIPAPADPNGPEARLLRAAAAIKELVGDP